MNVVEEAVAFARWLEERAASPAHLARLLGRDDSYVYKRLAILSLDEQSLSALAAGDITLHHGLELRRVDDPGIRSYLLEITVKNGASVDLLRQWVEQYTREGTAQPSVGPEAIPGPPPGASLVPQAECTACGRRADQVMLIARLLCADCDAALRAAIRNSVTIRAP